MSVAQIRDEGKGLEVGVVIPLDVFIAEHAGGHFIPKLALENSDTGEDAFRYTLTITEGR